MKTLIKTMVFLFAVTLATTARAGGQRTFTVNGVSFTMVDVEGGTFTMGATAEQGSDYNSDELPPHQVTLNDFMIGQTEVTEALWTAVMGSNPSYSKKGDNYPVENVTWSDCQTFITKLNQLTGATFRLPTEAEWEFAARGGNQSHGYKYPGSNTASNVAWYSTSAKQLVATKLANELGLYDMAGNVEEWCYDLYGSYSSGAQVNPTGASSGSYHVDRGNGWRSPMSDARVSRRERGENAENDLGLRLAMTAPIAAQTGTVQIGNGSVKNEGLPIINWCMNSYQGNEVIYLKDELGLRKGDLITSLSYYCIEGSADGGNFNVRIKNTDKSEIYRGVTDNQDYSILLVKNDDKIYGNVQLGSYSAGEWITFNLSEPFIYGGENIVVDIRNTELGRKVGWCYFASTAVPQPHRTLAWHNANAENLTGFIPIQGMSGPDYGFYLDKDDTDVESIIPNTKITYTKNSTYANLGDLNSDGFLNVADVGDLYSALLNLIDNVRYDINGDGSVNTGDVSALYGIILNPQPSTVQTFTANGLTYISEDGKTATLTYTDDSDSYGHNYSDLTSAQIPSTVTYNNRTFTVTAIGDNAFRKCASLSNVVIPSTVKEIGELAFYSCTALKSITIPESVEKLGRGVFGSCTQLQHITVHSNNPIFDSRNNCNAIIETATNTLVFGSNSTVIPSSVTAIGNDAFSGYNQLTSIAIPGSVTSIGNGAFYSCRGLSQIQLPNSVVSIGNNAFRLCTGLTDVSIPQSVTSIGKGAFSSCTKIETLSIGKNVKTIEDEAFSGCKNLNTVTNYATTPQSISENVFSNKGTLKVPEASLSTYKSTPVWSGFKSIVKI